MIEDYILFYVNNLRFTNYHRAKLFRKFLTFINYPRIHFMGLNKNTMRWEGFYSKCMPHHIDHMIDIDKIQKELDELCN